MLKQSLGGLAQQLAERLSGHNDMLCLALIRLLADGQAVSVYRLAAVLCISHEETAIQLQSLSDIEFDSAGNVIAFGLSHRPTAHQFTVNGHHLYTWCALDTFMYTALLDTLTQVRSTCPRTHGSISLVMTRSALNTLIHRLLWSPSSFRQDQSLIVGAVPFVTTGTSSSPKRLRQHGKEIS